MAAAVDLPPSLVPRLAAPKISDYTQFATCEVPPNSNAVRAYKGYIRPFSDNETARHALRAIERSMPIQIVGGRLYADASHLPKHPLEDFLIDMAMPFTILILEFQGTEHRRAFLVNPRMVPRLNLSPHIRTDKDKPVWINGQSYPALCVYSGSLFKYITDDNRLAEFLDQTATYLAKYLIWLRTRMLFRHFADGTRQFVYRRNPLEPVTEIDLLLAPDVYWDGYWPGPVAPSGPSQHLATIRRADECWCWSGKRYGDCCRPKDMARKQAYQT